MKEPEYSCPRIDSAIQEMEEARKIHNNLREWGHHWKDRCEEIERDYEKRIDGLTDDVSHLEDKCADLKNEVEELRRQLEEVRMDTRN